jgi:hypothetical protein
MPSLRFAEWTLALVTSRDRAATIVGDLAERAATRGIAWFWSAVLRTATSLLCHDLAGHPARFAGLALRGLALDFGLIVLLGVLSVVIIAAPVYLSYFLDLVGLDALAGFVTGFTGWASGNSAIVWRLYVAVPTLLFPLIVGRALARWAPGREVTACVAFATISAILGIATAIVLPGDAGVPVALWAVARAAVEDTILVLIGAMWGRHRNLSRWRPV